MKPLRAFITLRIRAGEIIATVSDGTETSIHRQHRAGEEVTDAAGGGVEVPEHGDGEPDDEAGAK